MNKLLPKNNRQLSTRIVTNTLFTISLFIIIAINIISFSQLTKFSRSNQLVSHTYDVLAHIHDGLLNLVEVESAIRGFVITHDKKLLKEIQEKKNLISQKIAETKKLTLDNKDQQKRIAGLESLVDERINAFVETLKSVTDNSSLYTQASFVLKGDELTKKITTLINVISNEEVNLLKKRNEASANNLNKLNTILLTGSIVSIVLFILGIIVLNISVARQQQFFVEKKKLDNLLRGILEGTDDIIVALNLNFCFMIFNKSFEREFKTIFGKRPILGNSIIDALSHLPEEQKKVEALWRRPLNGEEFSTVGQFGNPSLMQNTYECNFNSIYDESGTLIGAAAICRNIEARIKSEQSLMETNEKLEKTYQELKNHDAEVSLLNEMENALQACNSINETFRIIKINCQKLLPTTAGIVYLINPSRNYLEIATDWNSPTITEKIFSPQQCWGLRKGKNYFYLNSEINIPCEHIGSHVSQPYICAPLLAQNEVIGLLYISFINTENLSEDEIKNIFSKHEALLKNLTVQLALAIANIQLRETLKTRSVRDPLTGLYNRAYLNEFLERDLERAHRNNMKIAVVMMDIDHFKRINDQYGHEAGDLVLKEIGKLLQANIRGSDISCRYGGEEFLIILYDSDIDGVISRIEQIRILISQMKSNQNGLPLEKITASFGLAISPEHGDHSEVLIAAADQALYQSKKNGRNQLTIYKIETP